MIEIIFKGQNKMIDDDFDSGKLKTLLVQE